MASGHYKCKAELSIAGIDGGEIEQFARDTHFDGISNGDTLKKETEPFSKCWNAKSTSDQFGAVHIIKEEIVEDATETKPFSFWENTEFNSLAGELTKSKVNHSNNGDELINEDEDYPEYIDLCTNNAELKSEILKTEDDIDIVYEDVKPDKCEKKSSEKSENESDAVLLRGTEIEANFSHELSKDSKTCSQQSVEEGETAVESDNDTRKEPINSKNYQEIKERIHTEGKFECNICQKSFAEKKTLFRHEIIHTGEKPFQCTFCSKSFNQKGNLTVHERIHTGEKPFQCNICLKSFAGKNTLFIHERIHTGEKPFQCKICLRTFNRKGNLMKHASIHTGEKRFQCQFCSKSFTEKNRLLLHEMIHTGQKPFQCKICQMSFVDRYTLSHHEKIHTGKKPFQCKFCSNSFNRKGNCTIHERIHTGEKPFQCNICLKSFTGKNTLFRHGKIHTREKPHQRKKKSEELC